MPGPGLAAALPSFHCERLLKSRWLLYAFWRENTLGRTPENQLLDLCLHQGNPKDTSLTILLTLWQPPPKPELANLGFSCWISNLGAARPSDILCSPLHVRSRDRDNLPPRQPLRQAMAHKPNLLHGHGVPRTGQRLCPPWALGEEMFSPMIKTSFMWGKMISPKPDAVSPGSSCSVSKSDVHSSSRLSYQLVTPVVGVKPCTRRGFPALPPPFHQPHKLINQKNN